MYFKIIKSGTNRKLVYDFLLVVYSNFCRITHRFWEIWCATVQWPWNMPKVIDSHITWKLSCGHVCKMFGRIGARTWLGSFRTFWNRLSWAVSMISVRLCLKNSTHDAYVRILRRMKAFIRGLSSATLRKQSPPSASGTEKSMVFTVRRYASKRLSSVCHLPGSCAKSTASSA